MKKILYAFFALSFSLFTSVTLFADNNRDISFSNDDSEMRVELSKIKYDGRCLRLYVDEGERATIYNMKGEVVFTTNRSGEFQFDNLHKGLFIVRVGDQIKKILSK